VSSFLTDDHDIARHILYPCVTVEADENAKLLDDTAKVSVTINSSATVVVCSLVLLQR